MHIFISWSKPRSKAIALALRAWLPKVFQSTKVFMSEKDIEPGMRWSEEIARSLGTCDLGIVCVTPENMAAPWLQFEAGALAKQVGGDTKKVIPYLHDLKPEHLSGNPLASFQAARSVDPVGTFGLVESINAEIKPPLDGSDLRETFDVWWPKLAPKLAADEIVTGAPEPPPVSDRAMLVELLGWARGMHNLSQVIRSSLDEVSAFMDDHEVRGSPGGRSGASAPGSRLPMPSSPPASWLLRMTPEERAVERSLIEAAAALVQAQRAQGKNPFAPEGPSEPTKKGRVLRRGTKAR